LVAVADAADVRASSQCGRHKADLLVRGWGLGQPSLYVDAVLSCCAAPPGLAVGVGGAVRDCVGMAPAELRGIIQHARPLGHLVACAEAKRKKYARWHLQERLVPVAADSYGGFGVELQAFIKRAAEHAASARGLPSTGFKRFWRTALECELHRVFADSVRAHLSQQERGLPPTSGSRRRRLLGGWNLEEATLEVEALG